MITKCFEVRDRSTFMPVMAIKLCPGNIRDDLLIKAAGYSLEDPIVILVDLERCNVSNNPYEWKCGGARTLPAAHQYIEKMFDSLNSGDVIDVEFLEGETTEQKKSEVLKHL